MKVCKGIELVGGIDPECNIYVVDGEFIVDAGTGLHFGTIKKEIEAVAEPDILKLLINTHCHFDHTGANKKFRDWLKVSIGVHPADKDAVETGKGSLAEMFGHTPRIMTVDRVLRGGTLINTKNFSFEVIPTPGHTPGSICLYDKDKKILISGDTVFENSVGRTDYPGGSKSELVMSLKKLSELNVEYLLPGHGSPKMGGISFFIKQMVNFLTEDKKYI